MIRVATSSDWYEYLAWTRGAADGQYEITEEAAWSRLQRALLRSAVVSVELELLPEDDPDPDPSAPPSDC